MFTQTIVPSSSSITLDLPQNYVGELVTVIAVVEKKEQATISEADYEERLQHVKEFFLKLPRTNHSTYKFNREEANDFE